MREMRERARQFEPAAAHVGRPREHFDGALVVHRVARLAGLLPVHAHLARHDQRLRLLARFGEPALHQQTVQPCLHDLRWTIRSASSCRRSARSPKRLQHGVRALASSCAMRARVLQAVDRRET